jgi:hypothetical protein
MKKVSDYRKHAEECRALARGMKQAEQREQLLAMAKTWDRLAEQREITSRTNPDEPNAPPSKR